MNDKKFEYNGRIFTFLNGFWECFIKQNYSTKK